MSVTTVTNTHLHISVDRLDKNGLDLFQDISEYYELDDVTLASYEEFLSDFKFETRHRQKALDQAEAVRQRRGRSVTNQAAQYYIVFRFETIADLDRFFSAWKQELPQDIGFFRDRILMEVEELEEKWMWDFQGGVLTRCNGRFFTWSTYVPFRYTPKAEPVQEEEEEVFIDQVEEVPATNPMVTEEEDEVWHYPVYDCDYEEVSSSSEEEEEEVVVVPIIKPAPVVIDLTLD